MKKTGICIFLIVFSVLLITNLSEAGSKDQKKRIKKRVAVFIFEDKTDKSWRWWNNKGVGDGVAEMITTELVKSGNYRVIERRDLDLFKVIDDVDEAVEYCKSMLIEHHL